MPEITQTAIKQRRARWNAWAARNPDRLREYRKKNRKRDRALMRRWRQENPEKRRAQNQRYAERYPEKMRTKSRKSKAKWRAENQELGLFVSAKNNAKYKNREFSITLADVVIPDRCPILGTPFTPLGTVPRNFNPSIDRVDNSKGYIPGNVRIISWAANTWKGARTAEEVRALLKYMEGA